MQINALREAFSADVTRPFELKSNFPQGSPPAVRSSQSPHFPADSPYGSLADTPNAATMQHPSDSVSGQVSSSAYVQAIIHPITPPISIADSDPKTDSPLGQSLVNIPGGNLMTSQPRLSPSSAGVVAEQQAWNPTKIFEYVEDVPLF